MNNRLIIIDGNSLINRAYYAMQRPMITRDGVYTQGIYGFLNMLNKINREYESKYMIITFDRKAPTFRHLEYSEYKAGRKKMPMELAMQLPLLKDILKAMNIHMEEMDGYEADDLIGTIAAKAEEEGIEPLIITGDKDELQLASDTTKVMITKKGISEFELYDKNAMIEKYGFTPAQFIDFKGLMGDKSDNIPGVPGVGEKTAQKLILEYGSVENLLDNLEKMPANKMRQKLEDNRELAIMSKRLATINTAAPIEVDFQKALIEEPDYPELLEIYKKLEFSSFIRKLEKEMPDSDLFKDTRVVIPEIEMSVLSGGEELGNVLESLNDNIFIEVLTDNNHRAVPEIRGIGFMAADNPQKAYFIKNENGNVEALTSRINDGKLKLSGHDLKKSFYALLYFGLNYAECLFDSAIAEYVLNPSKSSYDLQTLALDELHMEIKGEKDLLEETSQMNLFDDSTEIYKEYLLGVLKAAYAIRPLAEEKLSRAEMTEVYSKVELPLISVLAAMEKDGVAVDRSVLEETGSDIEKSVSALESEIYEIAGHEFNINSPQQLGIVLFEELELPAGKKTKRGYSTSADILEKLRDVNPIIDKILNYRTLTKLNSTYIQGLMPLIDEKGRIHAHFQQTVTATGRLSCTEPNLQNIPIRQEYGRQLRKAFICPDDDSCLVGADYSQIELRVLAALSEDPELIKAFNDGEDIHKLTASKVLGIPEDEITFEQRSAAKAVNFGVIYGMSGFGLSSELNITRKEAEKYIAEYFRKYSAVKKFMDGQIAFCKENKYVKTLMGRRRYVNEISASNFMTRQLGERLAMNSPIQGSAADIIKIAMINVFNRLKEDNLKSRLILQIHDELIIETREDEADIVEKVLKEEMEKAVNLKVYLKAEVNRGSNWFDLK